MKPEEELLADQLLLAWTSFAKTGIPKTQGQAPQTLLLCIADRFLLAWTTFAKTGVPRTQGQAPQTYHRQHTVLGTASLPVLIGLDLLCQNWRSQNTRVGTIDIPYRRQHTSLQQEMLADWLLLAWTSFAKTGIPRTQGQAPQTYHTGGSILQQELQDEWLLLAWTSFTKTGIPRT